MAINLEKGQRISLEKDGGALTTIEIGVNWGAITKKGFLGTKQVAVDLDASVGMFDEQGNLVDTVWFRQLTSTCKSVHHSGDDRTGDIGGDDGQDNEIIKVDLTRVPGNVHQLALVLNSFNQQNFGDIPFANIRIHDGKAQGSGSVFAKFDIAHDPSFSGKTSMIMGSVYRHGAAWKFRSIGVAIADRDLKSSLSTFAKSYAS